MNTVNNFWKAIGALAVVGVFAGVLWYVTSVSNERIAAINSSAESAVSAAAADKQKSISELEAEFMAALSEIDRNLEIISNKEGIITVKPDEEEGLAAGNTTVKDKILKNIRLINSLMEENRNKMEILNFRIKKSDAVNANLKKLVDDANSKIENYEKQVASAKEQLSLRDFQYTDLNKKMGEVELKSQMFQELAEKYERNLYTAYVTSGTMKELKKEGVVDRHGGIFGIGGSEELKGDFKKESFSQIDIRKSTEFPVNSKRARLVTCHPSDSYEFKEEKDKITSLVITNPDEFWRASKYMVLAVK